MSELLFLSQEYPFNIVLKMLHDTVLFSTSDIMMIEEWKTQAKRGTLELCILTLLKENDYYGDELISVLANW